MEKNILYWYIFTKIPVFELGYCILHMIADIDFQSLVVTGVKL